jgi:histidinol-phosphatase (PHP family)
VIDRLTDSHVHTKFSPDADPNATFLKYVEKAKEIGLKRLIFTDHVDIDAVHPLMRKQINYDQYILEFLEAKKQSDIELLLGVEIGYQNHVIKEMNDFLKQYPFQYKILSIHYVDKMDLYTGEYYQNKTKQEAYQRYFEVCLEAINVMDDFDAFGHLDYITRYGNFGDYDYKDFKEVIDKILCALINKNKILEINTSGIDTEGRLYPKQEVVNRYLELGGTKFSLSSDAHTINELGRHFNDIR